METGFNPRVHKEQSLHHSLNQMRLFQLNYILILSTQTFSHSVYFNALRSKHSVRDVTAMTQVSAYCRFSEENMRLSIIQVHNVYQRVGNTNNRAWFPVAHFCNPTMLIF